MAKNRFKSLGSIAIIVLLLVVVVFKKCFFGDGTSNLDANKLRTDLISHKLTYSRHAKCRMKCRDITEEEVMRVLEVGKLNASKSSQGSGNCPSYAFEGNTEDGQNLRIIFANCPKTTKVVTCIDLGKEHACDCP